MERLTCYDIYAKANTIKNYEEECCTTICNNNWEDCHNCPIQCVIEKLAHYEELEENNLLYIFPAKVGDYIWNIEYNNNKGSIKIRKLQILSLSTLNSDHSRIVALTQDEEGFLYSINMNSWNVFTFDTEEKAKNKIKQIEGQEQKQESKAKKWKKNKVNEK